MAKSKKPTQETKLPLEVDTSGLLETKLTRSEAIELMLQQAMEQVETRTKENRARLLKLRDITFEQVQDLLGVVPDAAEVHYKNYDNKTVQITLTIPYDSSVTLQWLKDGQTEYKALNEENDKLYDVHRVLADRGKAKLAIMKQVLEGSSEGRVFLKQIETMSVALNGKLFANAGKPSEPQLTTTTTITEVVKVTVEG